MKVYVVMVAVNFEMRILGVFTTNRQAGVALDRCYYSGMIYEHVLDDVETNFGS